MNINVKIKKLDENAKIPTYASPQSAGADLYALCKKNILIHPGDTVFINTGIAIQIPYGYVGLVYARSGLASKSGLAPANKVGVIDCDYRGEIIVALHNHSRLIRTIENGDRIAQLVITPYLQADFEQADKLNDTKRGNLGFGSSGLK